jgi:hypothetical protein
MRSKYIISSITIAIVVIIVLVMIWYFTRPKQEQFAYEMAGQFVQQANNTLSGLGQTMQMAQQIMQGPQQFMQGQMMQGQPQQQMTQQQGQQQQVPGIIIRLQQLEQSLNIIARMGYSVFALLQSGGILLTTAIKAIQGLRVMLEKIVATINKVTALVYKYYKLLADRYFPQRQVRVPVAYPQLPVAYIAPSGVCQAPYRPVQNIQAIQPIQNPQIEQNIQQQPNLESAWNPQPIQTRNRMRATDRLGRFLGKGIVTGISQAINSKAFPIRGPQRITREDDDEFIEMTTPNELM